MSEAYFKNKITIVTGSASGIGKATANELSHLGAVVIGIDKKPQKRSPFQEIRCDLSNEANIIRAIKKIKKQTNKIDHLVNNAGILTIGEKRRISEQTLSQWNSILKTNITGMMLMMKHCYPLLKRASGASIVNVSSDQSFKGRIAGAAYGVSKAGINALTKVAALEMIDDKIRVNAVAPGAVKTNIIKALVKDKKTIDLMFEQKDGQLPFGISDPKDVSNLIIFLLSDKAKRITGEVVLADSGEMLL